MKTIIVGGGKIGFYLAKALLERGYEVTIIENDKETSRYCANNLDAQVSCGDGTTVEVLEACGCSKADCVIAVMGKDERNLVCCQTAKQKFGVKKTIAKVNNPKNADALKALGIDIVISATDNIIQLLEHEVDLSAMKRLLELDGSDASLVEITLPENYALEGKPIAQLELPPDCNLACINRNGRAIIPRGGTMLLSGDIILCVMLNNREKELKKALKLKK